MGSVAYGDDESLTAPLKTVEGARDRRPQIETQSARRQNGLKMNPFAGLCACRGRRHRMSRVPQSGCQLRAGGVSGAHERHLRGGNGDGWNQLDQNVSSETEVAAATVPVGIDSNDQSGILEHLEVMCQEI